MGNTNQPVLETDTLESLVTLETLKEEMKDPDYEPVVDKAIAATKALLAAGNVAEAAQKSSEAKILIEQATASNKATPHVWELFGLELGCRPSAFCLPEFGCNYKRPAAGGMVWSSGGRHHWPLWLVQSCSGQRFRLEVYPLVCLQADHGRYLRLVCIHGFLCRADRGRNSDSERKPAPVVRRRVPGRVQREVHH